MTKIEYGFLQDKRRDLERLIQLYEFACADIAPPFKVIDGMPYSLTNAVNSMTETKAVRLTTIRKEIDATTEEIRGMLGNLERINDVSVRNMIILRFLCAYDWKTVRDKIAPDKTTGNVRATVFYYLTNNL